MQQAELLVVSSCMLTAPNVGLCQSFWRRRGRCAVEQYRLKDSSGPVGKSWSIASRKQASIVLRHILQRPVDGLPKLAGICGCNGGLGRVWYTC